MIKVAFLVKKFAYSSWAVGLSLVVKKEDMNDFRVDALSLLTGKEPEEGMFVDWMFDIFLCLLASVSCCRFRVRIGSVER